MAIAFCTVLTDDYIPGFHALIKSIQYHNPGTDNDFIILCDADLSKRGEVKEIYEKSIFVDFHNKMFYDLFIKTNGTIKEKFHKCLYTLDVFNLGLEYDKIIFLDADMLCNGSIEEIIKLPRVLGFSYATGAEEVHRPALVTKYKTEKKEKRGARFNAGMFQVPGRFDYLSCIQKWMINHIKGNYNLPEQKIMNRYFEGWPCVHISRTYNALKRFFHDDWFDSEILKRCQFIHYVGSKPWKHHKEQGYEKIEQVWKDFYKSECRNA